MVALDIDGTLAKYHEHFTRFAEAWTGKRMPAADELTGGVPFHKHLGISKSTYRKVKLAYRQGGMKRSIEFYWGAGQMTRAIRAAGFQVWICTTRPYLQLENIDPDTRESLRRNGVQYDNVIYGEHKYRDLKRAVGVDKVVMVADDLPQMIDQACDLGMRAYMRTTPYNQSYDRSDMAGRVDSIGQMFDAFKRERQRFNGRR